MALRRGPGGPGTSPAGQGRTQLRRDAQANQERVLAAAVTTILHEGPRVPMATIAAQAGVGVGTLYRRYPTREALLSALQDRAYRIVLATATEVERLDEPGLASVDRFLESTIGHRGDLVLPMHGAPASLDSASVTLRTQISDVLQRIVERGQRDGSIRPDVTSTDVIIAGAMFAQPLPAVADWDRVARRHKQIFLDGIATAGPSALPHEALSRDDLEASFAAQDAARRPGSGPAAASCSG
jgi:AcrR family transcriptional regulator